MKGFGVLGLIVFLSVSCAQIQMKPVRNFESNPVPKGLTAEQVGKSIKLAAASEQWVVKEIDKKNVIEATVFVRSHEVTVRIPYDDRNYEVNYLSSRNMKYDNARNIIHRNYYHWVNNLQQAINIELRKTAARE